MQQPYIVKEFLLALQDYQVQAKVLHVPADPAQNSLQNPGCSGAPRAPAFQSGRNFMGSCGAGAGAASAAAPAATGTQTRSEANAD